MSSEYQYKDLHSADNLFQGQFNARQEKQLNQVPPPNFLTIC